MKRLTIVFWLISVTIMSIGAASVISQERKIAVVSGSLSLPEGSFVLFEESCDINSDSIDEKIYVYGEKQREEDLLCEDVNIAVVDKLGMLRRTNCNNVRGNAVKNVISDFNGDGIKDILVIMENNGVQSCVIGDFAHSIPKNIMTAKDLKGLQMKLHFTDGFSVSAELENGQMFSVNLSAHKERLCAEGIFSAEGKLVGGTPALSSIKKIETVEHDFGSNLLFTQELYVGEEKNVLCNIEAEMEYTGDTLLIKQIEYYL